MPTAKRLKSSSAAKAKQRPEPKREPKAEHPTPAEVEQEEHVLVQVARKHWLKPSRRSTNVKVKNDVLKQDIWDSLERENFPYKSLLLLESLQTLERYGDLRMPNQTITHMLTDIFQLPVAWLYRGSLELPCFAHCFDRQCQESGKFRNME